VAVSDTFFMSGVFITGFDSATVTGSSFLSVTTSASSFSTLSSSVFSVVLATT